MTLPISAPPDPTGTPSTGATSTGAPSTGAPARAVESRNPATGEVWRRFEPATASEVAAAVAKARSAQPAWAERPLTERIRVLRRFHTALYARRAEVALALTRENGKPIAEAIGSEIAISLDFANYYAAEAPAFLKAPWKTAGQLSMKRKRIRIEHEAHGVIGVVSPWNYPFMLSAGLIIPALVTGNTVLLKPSEFTPTSGALLAELFGEAGVPSDVFAVLQGDGAVGAALVNAGVDKVFFTGSVATGRKVAIACAQQLIPCSLELGGSDPAIVLADADVGYAASGIAWARFSNAGQTCVAPKRVYVEAPAYDAFVTALSATVRALRVGDGASSDTEVTGVIRPSSQATLEAQRADAVARGATIAAEAACPAGTGGSFVSPTVLTNVPSDARVLLEETFGPLLPVVKVTNVDEAIALSNASEFGLSASIWTRDSARGAALARRIQAGTVAVNDAIIVAGMTDVPHGGVKQSGHGRAHGRAGLEECVRSKTTVVDQFTAWRQPWWFGYGGGTNAGIDAFVRFSHGSGMMERIRAIPGLLRFLFAPQRPL
jgi:succinate-semialdehyde dehydrogenase/glutarate-semialdehyde dehydrogenase